MTTKERKGRPRLVEEFKAQAIVSDYQKGVKLTKIEETHGIPRATIYWLLERSGITADLRVKRNVRYQVDSVTATVYLDKIAELEDYISNLECSCESTTQPLGTTHIIGDVWLPRDDLKRGLDLISQYTKAMEQAAERMEAEACKSAHDEWPSSLALWFEGQHLKMLEVGVEDLLELYSRAVAACQILLAKHREERKRGRR